MLCITIAQLNLTVGDIEGNVARMVAAAQQAAREQSDLIVFSELALCGYYPGDMLDEPPFLQRVQDGLAALQKASAELPALHWVVGAPTSATGPGKRLHNSLLVLQGGAVRLQYAKQLLPTYNIFDERRHFEPGPDMAKVLRIGGTQVGLLVCEDGWNDHGADYATNPFERLRDAAPDLVISINASPSHVGKREQRYQIFGGSSRRHGLPILYVNQVGGHDQVVYDGASFAAEPEAGIVFEAPRFVEDLRTLRFDNGHFLTADGNAPVRVPAEGLPTMEFYRQQIVLGLRDYARRCGFKQVVVGSSGGIDSALTLALAAQALGPENVVGVTMPSSYSSSGSVDDSVALCQNLGVKLQTHPIAELVAGYAQQFEGSFGQPLQGPQARRHRHPGSLDTFSSDDDRTNHSFAEVIGNGAVSMLVNLDPTARLTCYYLSKNGEYRTVPVMVGDKYFAGTGFLELTTSEALLKNKDRLQAEIFDPEEA